MGEIPLYLPEVASILIFTLDDYKYMNPTTANDPAFLKTQSNLLKFRENAEELLKARVETLFKEREATKHKAREDTKSSDPEHMPQKDKTPEQEREDLNAIYFAQRRSLALWHNEQGTGSLSPLRLSKYTGTHVTHELCESIS